MVGFLPERNFMMFLIVADFLLQSIILQKLIVSMNAYPFRLSEKYYLNYLESHVVNNKSNDNTKIFLPPLGIN